METIYTIEEISQYLRVPAEVIEGEVRSGRLKALDIAGHIRISESALVDYKNAAIVRAETIQGPKSKSHHVQESWLALHPAANFIHRWPDGKVEEYKDVREGVATYEGRQYHVKLGWTLRKSGGEERQRWLVIVDRYPTVEFVKCSDSGPDGNECAASIIRDRKGKQVPPLTTVPSEYKDFSTVVYSQKVKGPGSSNGQAVLAAVDDFETMVQHALIRTRYREARK